MNTPCGCATCPHISGGYQIHFTLDYEGATEEIRSKFELLLKYNDTELIVIDNFIPSGGNYTEYITSKNFKDFGEVDDYIISFTQYLNNIGIGFFRVKIESNPKNQRPYLYKEVHYKIDKFDKEKLYPYCFFSQNTKKTDFATERFGPGQDVILRHHNYVIEDVILDTNPELDKRLRLW